MEQRYTINYFNDGAITYYGSLEGAIKHAEQMMNLIVSCTMSKGDSITITNEYGKRVACQTWTRKFDDAGEYWEPRRWVY